MIRQKLATFGFCVSLMVSGATRPDECSAEVDEYLGTLAVGTYMSGDRDKLKEADALISKIKSLRRSRTDCDVFLFIESNKKETQAAPAPTRRDPTVVPNLPPKEGWEDHDVNRTKMYLYLMEGAKDVIAECNRLFPASSYDRTQALETLKQSIEYERLYEHIMNHMEESGEKEDYEISREFHRMTRSKWATTIGEPGCTEYALTLPDRFR